MQKKGVLFLAIAVLGMLMLPSCNSETTGKNNDDSFSSNFRNSGIPKRFGATYMTMNNPFFEILDSEIKSYINDKGDKLTTLDPEFDVQKQISCVGELVSQGVDLIFLNPLDYKEIKPALETAQKANIPVIVVDAPVFDEELVAATIASDNYEAGVLCAKDVVKRVGKNTKTNIVILEHPNAKSAEERIEGFEKEIAKYPDMNIIARRASNGQLEMAMSTMQNVLAEYNDIDVIMSLNDPTAIGAIAALKAADRFEGVLVYGIDGSEDGKKLIKSGDMTATVAQFPKTMGRIAVESAYKLLAGEKIAHKLRIEVKLVDQTNIEFYTQ